MLRFLTAGESHGPCLIAIIEGMPAGLPLTEEDVNRDLRRRQGGYGRGKRMQIESDHASILSGIAKGITTGAPIALHIANRDWANWKDREIPPWTTPRPGHADLAGGMKYGLKDLRLVLERASARETACRVAVGALCKQFLEQFDISIFSHVIQIGNVRIKKEISLEKIPEIAEESELRCVDTTSEKEMIKLVNKARRKGDSLGGVFEVIINGLPVGLGSYVHWDRRLDAFIGEALLSIPGIKAVEIGEGITNSSKFGSQVQDEIFYKKKKGFYRKTNRAGGLEGGVSNGMPIVVRGYMKPIATLGQPLSSVDINKKRATRASKERADVCAVPSAGVIAEAMLAYIMMKCFLEKFGCDSLKEIKNNYKNYLKQLEEY